MVRELNDFEEIWLVDFEFSAPPGDRPTPVCLVALELRSGRKLRLWEDELWELDKPPYSTGASSLFVAYYASAEMGCHLALNWPLPANVLDLFVEFRNLTNGTPPPSGKSLLGALIYFGLPYIDATEKEAMRELAIRGGPFSDAERAALLDYCESDVLALERLLPSMEPQLDLPRALLRGRYMKAAAHIEHTGTPMDVELLARLRDNWYAIQDQLITRIDADYGVFDGRTFKAERWADYLMKNNIPWPRLESGAFALDDCTFKQMASIYPSIAPVRELREMLSKMRLSDISVGPDSRNRCLLSAFGVKTGRNQPSPAKFIFGMSSWLRGLIKPQAGQGLAYIDWSQQEFGIAAALSGDEKMMAAYASGDPYLAFAKQAGAVPPEGTKGTHGAVRDQFKQCVLAVQYGMGPEGLARRINQPLVQARELLRLHRETYKTYWAWSEAAVNHAMLQQKLWTVFGWTLHVGPDANARSLQNFPMQANGAEMLRLACCLATEAGVKLCAPVHDAILIEAPLDELDVAVGKAQRAMEEASAIVLNGFLLRSDVKPIKYPERYEDERGGEMWKTVSEILSNTPGGVR